MRPEKRFSWYVESTARLPEAQASSLTRARISSDKATLPVRFAAAVIMDKSFSRSIMAVASGRWGCKQRKKSVPALVHLRHSIPAYSVVSCSSSSAQAAMRHKPGPLVKPQGIDAIPESWSKVPAHFRTMACNSASEAVAMVHAWLGAVQRALRAIEETTVH